LFNPKRIFINKTPFLFVQLRQYVCIIIASKTDTKTRY